MFVAHDPTRGIYGCPAHATRTVWPVVALLFLAAPALHPQVTTDLTVTMSDGVLLEATVTTPSGTIPPTGFPGIVIVHGYGGNKTEYAPVAQYLSGQGYASLLYSVRGQGNSGGLSTTMGDRERMDLLAVVRFFRSYPEIDSLRIGVAGGSQGGIHAWMAAAYNMPGVVAIATLVAPPSFALDLIPSNCFKQQLWAELSLSTVRYDPQRELLKTFVIAGQYDSVRAFVSTRDLERLVDSVRIPVMQLLGWADMIFPANGAIRALQRLSSRGVPVRSYFGTNGHGEPVNFNETLFMLAFMTSWFDHWFKGSPLDNAGQPYVVFADNRPGWPHRETVGWPPQPAGGTRLFLAGSSIRISPPVTNIETPFTLNYDPAYTPASGWTDGYQGTAFVQAFRSAPARFLSAPLADTLDLTGIPRATIVVRSSATRYQAHARLFDVTQTDTGFVWTVVTRGANGVVTPYAGAQVDRTIDFEATSHHFSPGHRIGVEVTSLDMYDSQRSHIVPYFTSTAAVVLSSPQSPSYIDLPLIGSATFTSVTASAAELPGEFALHQNYPNPFNPTTSIAYAVAGARGHGSETSHVKLAVYDLLGREVAVLVDEVRPAGTHQVTFDAGGLASGMYVYRLSAAGISMTKRMVVLR
jgi:predicted acyl esterase